MLFSSWLELREPADAAARAPELVERVRQRLSGDATRVIHDLGCGTGSMGRWLAPQLDGAQHWVLYDRDPHLLELAAASMAEKAADGSPVTVETRQRDVSTLAPEDLAGAALVTASALLDILTAEEIGRVAAACAGAACPALLTLSVVGRVEFSLPEEFDAEIMAAFNEHQRRVVAGRRLAGPDAVEFALAAFGRLGVSTTVRPSPWRLGIDNDDLMNADLMNVDLTTEWFVGWVAAACEQRPDLTEPAAAYARRRLAEVADGRVVVVVHHDDVLAGA